MYGFGLDVFKALLKIEVIIIVICHFLQTRNPLSQFIHTVYAHSGILMYQTSG